jgi:AcrR family transcriptional regulator
MTEEAKDTRERLLEAAENLFADRGCAAVSVRDIAAEAEVNVAAVNYHFQGKDNLYHEVLRRVMLRKQERYLAAVQKQLDRGPMTLADIVRIFFQTHFEDTLKHRSGSNFLKLLVREIHHGTSESAPHLQQILQPMWDQIASALQAAEPQIREDQVGWIMGSLHGQLVHFTMRWHQSHAPCVGEGAARAIQSMFPPLADDVDEYIALAVDHITRFSIAGIQALVAGETPQEANS